ncbi:helix-turn-helix transcriptional regulator [Paucilactobacillus suebicus]|uniref:HTH cro/C1-type domain-containing protein n=1 Tax=Paucilactobacillus suebicus DSM 5007 = KCTC 3549 TaxID=1423807 RepID=A0A0R1VX68_9LACO|nr:helix-turn-helix transcriptional regulator [Paucilactobacillus suebicus]KRM10186.1 hypothetical protein FD16_GL001456 [Paucilactobacillus suebicus DSM 5007 = KCTC 3549]
MQSQLARLRRTKRMTQADLACATGIKYNVISEYESGRYYPSMENAIKLADYFNVSIDELIGRKELTAC